MLLTWFPALPPWDGLHPAVVQFPLALLLAAPLLVLVSLFVKPAARALGFSALGLMLLGTCALWLAAGTGHAAGQLVEHTPELERAILHHEALAMGARTWFTLLTLVYALALVVPLWARREEPPAVHMGVHVAFLVAYVVFIGVLAQAADAGGHLVHQYGVRAMVQVPDTLSQPVATVPVPAPPVRARLR